MPVVNLWELQVSTALKSNDEPVGAGLPAKKPTLI